MLDENLDWNDQILNVSKKISRGIGILYRLRGFIGKDILLNISYSLIYTHLMYGIEIWVSASQENMLKLLLLQKKAIRAISFSNDFINPNDFYIPTDPLFKNLEILKVDDIYSFKVSVFIYQCLTSATPFESWFSYIHDSHIHSTRQGTSVNRKNYFDIGETVATSSLHHRYSRLINYGGKSMKVSGPVLWNKIPDKIRDLLTLSAFKKDYKLHLLQSYHNDESI